MHPETKPESDPTLNMAGQVMPSNLFTNWHDFVEQVAIPLVENDDPTAWQLYQQTSPHFICTSLILATRSHSP